MASLAGQAPAKGLRQLAEVARQPLPLWRELRPGVLAPHAEVPATDAAAFAPTSRAGRSVPAAGRAGAARRPRGRLVRRRSIRGRCATSPTRRSACSCAAPAAADDARAQAALRGATAVSQSWARAGRRPTGSRWRGCWARAGARRASTSSAAWRWASTRRAHRGALERRRRAAEAGHAWPCWAAAADVAVAAHQRALYGAVARARPLVSRVRLGLPARAWRFPARNRVIAALGRAVVIVEGAERSGARITAASRSTSGARCWRCPARPGGSCRPAPHALLRDGAELCESAPTTCSAAARLRGGRGGRAPG